MRRWPSGQGEAVYDRERISLASFDAAEGDICGVKRFLLDFSIALGQELKNENVSVMTLCGGLPTTDEHCRALRHRALRAV